MLFRLILTTALTITAGTQVGAAAWTRDQAAIRDQSRRLDRAFEQRDFAVWRRVLAENFTASSPSGKISTRAEYIKDAMDEAASAIDPVAVRIEPISISVKGAHAKARWRELTCYGVRDKQQVKHRLCYRQAFRDEWSKTASEWKPTRIVYSKGAKFFLDGRPAGHQEMMEMLKR